jgi:hypothetical protein
MRQREYEQGKHQKIDGGRDGGVPPELSVGREERETAPNAPQAGRKLFKAGHAAVCNLL